jgi:O-antigen/teichoic acid export membrane protein
MSVLLSLISLGLLTRYLGAEKYGWFTLVFTYVSFFTTLADIGYNQTIVREFSRDIQKSKEIFGTLFNFKLILIGISIIAALVGLLFVPYQPDLKVAIVIGIVALAISNLSSYGTSILQSQLRLDLVALLDLIVKGITVLFIFFFVRWNLNFYYSIYAILFGNLIGACIEYFFIKDWIVIGPYFDRTLIRRMIKISLPVGITAVLTMLYFKVDTLMLSIIRSPVEVGIYALAYKILDNVIMLWGLIMASIFPLLSRYHGKNDSITYKKLLRNTVKLSIVLSIFILLVGHFFAPFIIRVLGGSKFYSSIAPLKVLLWAVPFLFLDNIFYNVMLSFGKTTYMIIPLLTSLVVTVVLNSLIIPTYGYMGASYVTVITEIITAGTYLYLFITKFKEERQFLTHHEP